MEEKKTENKKKLTYEELEKIAINLSNQLNKVNTVLNRLPYLFKVVEFADKFHDEFVKSCVKEIEEIMTIPEDNGEA